MNLTASRAAARASSRRPRSPEHGRDCSAPWCRAPRVARLRRRRRAGSPRAGRRQSCPTTPRRFRAGRDLGRHALAICIERADIGLRGLNQGLERANGSTRRAAASLARARNSVELTFGSAIRAAAPIPAGPRGLLLDIAAPAQPGLDRRLADDSAGWASAPFAFGSGRASVSAYASRRAGRPNPLPRVRLGERPRLGQRQACVSVAMTAMWRTKRRAGSVSRPRHARRRSGRCGRVRGRR